MVIQRWQSVLLLMAFLFMGCFTFFSLGQVQAPDFTYNFTSMGFYPEGVPGIAKAPESAGVYTWSLFIVSLMSAIIPFIAIFMFKNFRIQKTLCWISILFICCSACLAAYYGYTMYAPAACSWSVVAWCPLLAIASILMAVRRIRSDERALRSLDRMR